MANFLGHGLVVDAVLRHSKHATGANLNRNRSCAETVLVVHGNATFDGGVGLVLKAYVHGAVNLKPTAAQQALTLFEGGTELWAVTNGPNHVVAEERGCLVCLTTLVKLS